LFLSEILFLVSKQTSLESTLIINSLFPVTSLEGFIISFNLLVIILNNPNFLFVFISSTTGFCSIDCSSLIASIIFSPICFSICCSIGFSSTTFSFDS